jgi:hypothetical protein
MNTDTNQPEPLDVEALKKLFLLMQINESAGFLPNSDTYEFERLCVKHGAALLSAYEQRQALQEEVESYRLMLAGTAKEASRQSDALCALRAENSRLQGEVEKSVEESNRRDQKWMEGIDSIVGRKLRYTLATINDSPGFDLVPDLQDFIRDLRASRDAAQARAQQAEQDMLKHCQNAHDSAVEMAASYLERIGDYGANSKANAIRGEAFEDWERFKATLPVTPSDLKTGEELKHQAFTENEARAIWGLPATNPEGGAA